MQHEFYFGTILLEKNRWREGKQPSVRVSEWLPRIAQAGFDGIELWENHAAKADQAETAAIAGHKLPVRVFNTYADFARSGQTHRAAAARLAAHLGATGVKFNFGPDPNLLQEYIGCARAWAALFPANVRLLCECHEGTVMEQPSLAKQVFESLGDPRFQAIVHPFSDQPHSLEEWFSVIGPRITHAHAQIRDAEGKWRRLDNSPAHIRANLRLMKEAGFQGSFTLEFTEGVGAAEENIEELFTNALNDYGFIRESLGK